MYIQQTSVREKKEEDIKNRGRPILDFTDS